MQILPTLDYDIESFGSRMSSETFSFHYGKHHQAYVDKLNTALALSPELEGRTLEDLLTNVEILPDISKKAIRNNGGGHYNHSLFWQSISPKGGNEPVGAVAEIINNKYGSYQKFIEEFTAKAMGVFGSGWVFLQPDGDIVTTANQDTPIMLGMDAPILCLDIWEHAYYIDYRNKRDDYIKTWWNIVDWSAAENRYKSSTTVN